MTTIISPSVNWPPEDPEQKKVALQIKKYENVIVEAPPGTGKTFTGVCLALHASRLGWTSSIHPSLFLTFSRNARVQIERGIDEFQENSWLTPAEAKTIKVSNYHSFYFEILSKRAGVWGYKGNMRPATIAETESRIKRSLDAVKINDSDRLYLEKRIKATGSLFFSRHQKDIPPEISSLLVQEAKNGLLTGRPAYDDFAPLILYLIKTSPSLLEWLRFTYPLVVLDEFQDTDNLQWEILQLWHPQRLAVFYDRFQMIYRWRGATFNRPMELVKEFLIPTEAQLELTTTHRTGAQKEFGDFILELRADNLLGGNVVSRIKRPWLTLCPAKSRGRPLPPEARCRDTIRWGKFIDLKERTAIITRANYLANFLRAELSPSPRSTNGQYFCCSRIGSDDSPDESLRDLLERLRQVANDKEIASWLGCLLDKLLINPYRVNSTKIYFEEELVHLTKKGLNDIKLQQVRERISLWRNDIAVGNYTSFAQGLECVLEVAHSLTKGQAYPDPDWVFYVRQLIKTVKATLISEHWGNFCDRLEATVLVGNHFGYTTRPGLYILTAHQSKGREFDHVILPWLAKSGEPSINKRKIPYNYTIDDDRKLFYVALTRASKRVTMIYPEESPAEILYRWKLLPFDYSEFK